MDERKKVWKRPEKHSCSHIFPDKENERLREKIRLVKECINNYSSIFNRKCDYCGEVIKHEKADLQPPYFKEKRPELTALTEEHLTRCKAGRKIISTIDAKKDNNLSYDNEESLKKKGYCEISVIDQIKIWGLINRINLPNLAEEKRIGMVKVLSVKAEEEINTQNFQIKSGWVSENLLLLTPRPSPITLQNFSNSVKKSKSELIYFNNETINLNFYERIVDSFFIRRILQQKQKYWDYNIYHLKFSKGDSDLLAVNMGESGTLSLYLSLLSAYHQKPISKEVAATGFLNIDDYSKFNYCPWCFQEEIKKDPEGSFFKHKISSVSGLEYKIPAAVEAGVKKLILSTKQKEDYEKNVPPKLREKLTVYYVKNVEELEKLFWAGEFS